MVPVLRFPVLRFPVLRTLVLLWLLAPAALAEPAVHVRIDRAVNHYVVDDFYGYVVTSTQDETLLTQRGLGLRDRASFMFYPTKQSVEVVEAWVDQPDGARVIVPASSIFTRVSPTAAISNGFVRNCVGNCFRHSRSDRLRSRYHGGSIDRTPSAIGKS